MKKDYGQWISASDAAAIISDNSGRPVQEDYVRLLARQKPHMLRHKPLNGRRNLYFKPDVEKIKVKIRRVASKAIEQPPIENAA